LAILVDSQGVICEDGNVFELELGAIVIKLIERLAFLYLAALAEQSLIIFASGVKL